MAENQNNNKQIPDYTRGPIENLNGTDVAKALIKLADAIEKNPDALNLGRRAPTESQSAYAESKWKMSKENPKAEKKKEYRSRGNLLDDFEQGIKDQLKDSIAGGDFQKNIKEALNTFTKEFGFDIRNVGHEAGKALTKKVAGWLEKSPLGQEAGKKLKSAGNWALNKAFDRQGADGQAAKQGVMNVLNSFLGKGQGAAGGDGASSFISQAASKIGNSQVTNVVSQGAANVGSGAGTALAGKGGAVLAKGAAALGPYALLIVAIAYTIVKVLGPAIKGLVSVVKSLGKSFNREEEQRKKMLENSKKRMEADIQYLTEQPFKILEEAAEKWASTWDSNLRKIGQTQGYDKSAVYALYEGYAQRLKEDNLTSAIDATEIVDKLSTVLDSGLSGAAAEEFAYIATKLNALIPTQDFFGYVDTYASVAANAIAQGQSQSEALAAANAQLWDFANNLTFSSRELAGGFTTGLKNGSSLFKDAVQIAQSAKSANVSDISGTLTSVSAIVGAVAPDLAESLVSNVVQAAIGGNSDTIVALRSLAGINAGNTDFLKALAENPKQIFYDLFSNLATKQSMSPDNYMETAENLANIFGIDKAAFARVDFNYLANAINAMNTNSASLEENLALLQSGQTTTTAEQLKYQEISNQIMESGLAYVIDSEAGRMIQQHMWDEQRDNALMNNEYAVSLQGSALEFLEGIRKTMTTLMNFLNPIGFIAKGVSNLTQTIAQSVGNEQDIKEVLELGAVGGNAKAYANLTTRGKDLGLTSSLVEMMGGKKGTSYLNNISRLTRKYGQAYSTITGIALGIGPFTGDEINYEWDKWTSPKNWSSKGISNIKSSQYSWGGVGKSVARALQSTSMNSNTLGSVTRTASTTSLSSSAKSNQNVERFLNTLVDGSVDLSKTTYDQWKATAKQYHISDFAGALEEYGRTETELMDYFESASAQQGAAIKEKREAAEREFWGYETNGSGVFSNVMWTPFFGEGQKYDSRMDQVDAALTTIQSRIGMQEKHTVIGGLEELSVKIGNASSNTVIGILTKLESDVRTTFMGDVNFQRCLDDWDAYIKEAGKFSTSVSKADAWKDLSNAEKDQQSGATLALANALNEFSAAELKNMDPQLQANVILGEILVILQAIMQQNNTVAGGLSLIDTISALSLGKTK